MARIVIGCESGANPALLWDTARIGTALTEAGHDVHHAVGDPVAFVEFGGPALPGRLWQAPAVPAAPSLLMRPPQVASLSDKMALLGFNRASRLRTLAGIWAGLLETIAPDAIIALGAPVLTMVGPTRAATYLAGDNYALPPHLAGQFPRLSADIAPVIASADLIDNANAALTALGGTPIQTVTELHERCTELRYGLAYFDPYLSLRRGPSLGLLGGRPKPGLPPVEIRLAVFLDIYCPNVEAYAVALAGLENIAADVCIKGATEGMVRFLTAQTRLRYFDDYSTLMAQADSATAIVHHGLTGIAEMALAAGKPQLVVPWTDEQTQVLNNLKTLGVTWEKAPRAPLKEIASTLRDLANDSSIAANSQFYAQNLAAQAPGDAMQAIVERVGASG